MTRLHGAYIAILTAIIMCLGFAVAPTSTATEVQKVTVCHATSSDTHPYSKVQVPKGQIAGGYGHGDHENDIWAEFTYDGKTVDAQGDQTILEAGCAAPCPETQSRTDEGEPVPCIEPEEPPVVVPPNPTPTPIPTCPPPNLYNAVKGSHGNDLLLGTRCQDVMAAHGGNDVLFGFESGDLLLGQRGNDIVNGGPGVDVIRGGWGDDRLVSRDGTPGDGLIGGIGFDVCIVDAGDRVKQCERVRVR